MFVNILIFLAAASGGAIVLTIGIRILQDMKSPSEVLKRELTIENDEKKLTIETEGNISPSEVLEAIGGVENVMTQNEARELLGLKPVKCDPFVEFQAHAHMFGVNINEQNGGESVGGSTIRRAYNCKNCGGNLFENNICCYCGTLYKND